MRRPRRPRRSPRRQTCACAGRHVKLGARFRVQPKGLGLMEEDNMFRSIIGFAVFALVALIALKVFGLVIGLVLTLLVWAAFGFVIYAGLRVVSPRTADKLRELIKGRPADA